MAAQGERILVAGGALPDAPDAGQCFQLVGQGQRQSGGGGGQGVAGKAGLVVLGNGIGHGLAFAVVARIVAAHDALQLGKLAHHAGEQVGLGQQGRAFGIGRAGTRGRRQRCGQPLDAGAAFGLRAQTGVIDHLRQLRQPVGQCLLAVLVVEELCIGQTGAHHALVAVDDAGRIIDAHVRDDQELVLQGIAGIEQRKIPLVGAHAQDQAFLRHRQKIRIELPGVHGGPFHQGRHLVQQRSHLLLLLAVDGQNALVFLRGPGQFVGDHHAAGLMVRLHTALVAQLLRVAVGVTDVEGAAGQEAMPHRGAARLQTQHRGRQYLAAVQQHQPMGRAHEADRGQPVGQLVGHDLRDGQLAQRFGDDVADHIGQHGTGLRALPEEHLLFAVAATGEGRDIGALFFGPFLQGHGGLAAGIQPHGHRRAFQLDFTGIGLGPYAGNAHRQPAWRGVDGGCGSLVGQQLVRCQPRTDAFGKTVGQPGQRVRGQLFGLQLDQQGRVSGKLAHGRAPSLAWFSAVIIGKPRRSRDS